MNRKVKLGAIVGLLILSGGLLFSFSRSGGEAIAKTDATRTIWMCAACGDSCDLTAEQVGAMSKAASGLPLICSKCKERKLYRAIRCATCNGLFFSKDVPGSSGACHRCNADNPRMIDEGNPDTGPGTDEGTDADQPGVPGGKRHPPIKGA